MEFFVISSLIDHTRRKRAILSLCFVWQILICEESAVFSHFLFVPGHMRLDYRECFHFWLVVSIKIWCQFVSLLSALNFYFFFQGPSILMHGGINICQSPLNTQEQSQYQVQIFAHSSQTLESITDCPMHPTHTVAWGICHVPYADKSMNLGAALLLCIVS